MGRREYFILIFVIALQSEFSLEVLGSLFPLDNDFPILLAVL